MYKLTLSSRYLFKKRISYLALAAVALCVFIVVVVMTIMSGLVAGFKQKNHDFVGDCVVTSESLVGFAYYEDFMQTLEQADFVEAVSPVIKSYVMINRAGAKRNFGKEIIGIDAARHSQVTGFGDSLYHNSADPAKAFIPVYNPELTGCVLGIELWLQRDSQGKRIKENRPYPAAFEISTFPLTARGALARGGAGEVSTKTFYYSDNSHTGLARVDGSTIYLPFEWAQKLCMAGTDKRTNAIYIKFKPDVKLEQGRNKVNLLWQDFKQQKAELPQANLLENVNVQTWKEYRRTFIAAMEKEQTMLTVMFALVGITTVFIIFVVFYMIVSHKTKDIGILKSLGVSSGNVAALFGNYALMLGLLGSAIGSLGGWYFLLYVNEIEKWLFEKFEWQMWDRSLYVGIDQIPNDVDIRVVAIIIMSTVLACLLGALAPSFQAARLKPVQTLQVNQL